MTIARVPVTYYYRGLQEGSPVYSRAKEYPWMRKLECQRDAKLDGKKAVFSKENEIMATKKLTARQDFIRRIQLASKIPRGKSLILARELWAMGPYSSLLAEHTCNRELSERETKRDNEMDARVAEIGVELGLKAERQGDPRGWTIRVYVGKELANCWDGLTTGCG
jgi:hypothetical protein